MGCSANRARETFPQQVVSWLYPLNDRRHHYQEKISRLAFRRRLNRTQDQALPRRVNEIDVDGCGRKPCRKHLTLWTRGD